MSRCPALRFFSLILLAASAFAQNTRLTFRPVAAEWSAALNRIVMISATPDELHLFDPATQLTQSIPLPAAPLSVSISPNGFYAAVSHAASASYIDLRARTVVSTRPYPAGSGSLPSPYAVLDSNWLYILSPSGYASFPLPQGDGFGRTEYRATGGRLHPAGGFIYGTRDSTSPNDIEQLTLGPGLISARRDSPYHGEFSFCGNIWYSPDGRRIYNSCGTAVRAPAMDAAEIFFPSRVRWLSEAGTGRIAVIPDAPPSNGTAPPQAGSSTQVVLLSSSAYTEIGRLALPTFPVGQRSYSGLGRWIFFNNSGTALHVVYQAEAAAGISDDFGVQTYELASPAPCTATFPTAVLPVRAEGILQTVPIQAAPDCVRTVTSNAEWAQVVSGAYGAGNGNFTLHVRANYGNQPRSATLSMGTQTMQITQPAAPAAVPRQQVSSYAIVDAAFSKALDRMVLVTSPPNELHLVNPLTRTDDFVPLTRAPTALALSANGQRAAVGHANAVSIVDLQSRTVEKVIPTSIIPATLVLAGDWVYVFSARGGQVVRISTGVPATLNPGATFSRLTASGNLAYFGLAGYGNPARIDVSAGGAMAHYFSLSSGICNGLWTSDDDRRVYSACGDVFRTSEVLEQDLASNGKLSAAAYGVLWVTHAANRQQLAALVRPDGTATPPPPDVQIYGDDGLPLLGRLRLSPRIEAGITHPLTGKWLFWNQAATHLFAVAQVNLSGLTAELQASPPLSQFSVETVPVADVLGCTISVTPQSPTLSGAGGTVEVSVQTAPACSWTAAVTTATWLTITTPSGSPDLFYSSAGPATLILRAERNHTGAPRSATVTIANTSITVTQPVPDPLVVAVTSVSALAFTHTATVQVTATGPGLPWTAFSNVPWITILDSPNRFGTSAISYRVAGNSGPPRTGTMTVAGRTVTVNQAAASLSDGFRFVPVTPCRIADTRLAGGAFGQPVMQPGTQRDFPVPSSSCGIPATARAYSLNVTVVPHEPLGYLTLWPAGQPRPFVSTLNSFDGRIKANAAIVPAGASGAISAFVTNRADVILDINGYFVSSTVNADALGYVRVTPCRPIDTSSSGATLAAGETRTFNLAFACSGSVSSLAKALALNVTATPRSGGLAYLTVWPTGQPRPTVSTLNSFTGVRTSNAAIVATDANTSISVYVTDRADIAIDVVGYFSDSSTIGASFFPLAPCRLLDTRTADGPFGGPALTGNLPRNILLPAENACGIPDRAHGLSLNATVVPPGQLNSLTLLPYLQQTFTPSQTTTLHAPDGVVTSNAALVTSLPGLYLAITAYASAQTHLILDVNGYFALIYAP